MIAMWIKFNQNARLKWDIKRFIKECESHLLKI